MELVDNLNLHFVFVGVVLAALAYFFLGGIWYSEKLFGGYHKKHHYEGTQMPEKPGVLPLMSEFIVDLVMAYVLALFINFAGARNWSDGLLVGLWIWIGFIATTQMSAVIWSKRNLKSFLVTAGFVFFGLLIMGAIIGLFKSL